ncbi:MAG: heparan-alpha-glucosaminide N-acetyltransferase [Thiohalomonadales bacterium]|nr:heparan-alpha-glucosaminide N-acetyltransferase [Thiohalomonadales bacterium]
MPVSSRFQLIDIFRGVAIVLMVLYHFCYDLEYFSLASFDFSHDPFWLGLRTLIVSLFLGLVGVSLVLANENGLNPRRYFKRLGMLVLFALAITVTSYFMFPGRTIVFGILHFIAFASVAGLLFVSWPLTSLVIGIGLIGLNLVFEHRFFDQPAMHWIGLMTHRPATEDYVPVIPWFGVVLIGIFLGHYLLRISSLQFIRRYHTNRLPGRGLALAGRHSLLIYMLHQPILFGLLWSGIQILN